MSACRLGWLFGALLVPAVCAAQPVYRCESKGSVTYSHEPCLGAKVVDTTPTQGLDRSSGQTRKGADVQRSETNKAMANAMKPLFNESPEQRALRHKRSKLPPAAASECYRLDGSITAAGRSSPQGAGAASAEEHLFGLRKRYRELGC